MPRIAIGARLTDGGAASPLRRLLEERPLLGREAGDPACDVAHLDLPVTIPRTAAAVRPRRRAARPAPGAASRSSTSAGGVGGPRLRAACLSSGTSRRSARNGRQGAPRWGSSRRSSRGARFPDPGLEPVPQLECHQRVEPQRPEGLVEIDPVSRLLQDLSDLLLQEGLRAAPDGSPASAARSVSTIPLAGTAAKPGPRPPRAGRPGADERRPGGRGIGGGIRAASRAASPRPASARAERAMPNASNPAGRAQAHQPA